MAGGGGGDGKTPTLNVVSMVDVIFNVIVFFILTAKAANEEMVKVFVPRVDNPAITPIPDAAPRLVVTILYADDVEKFSAQSKQQRNPVVEDVMEAGPKGVPKIIQVGTTKVSLDEKGALNRVTDLIKEAAKKKGAMKTNNGVEVNSLEVLVRANMAAPYGNIQPVWTAIMNAGVSKANLMTLTGK